MAHLIVLLFNNVLVYIHPYLHFLGPVGPRCMPLSEPALIPPIPSFFESRSGSCSFFNDKVATTLRYGSRPFYPYVQCIFILTHFGFSCSLQFYNLLYCRFNHFDMKQIINTYFNTVVFTKLGFHLFLHSIYQ